MVSEFLIGRLREHVFPEFRGENAVGLGYGIKGGPGEVTRGGGTAPGQGVAVIDSGLLRHSGLDDDNASGAGNKAPSAQSHGGRSPCKQWYGACGSRSPSSLTA